MNLFYQNIINYVIDISLYLKILSTIFLKILNNNYVFYIISII